MFVLQNSDLMGQNTKRPDSVSWIDNLWKPYIILLYFTMVLQKVYKGQRVFVFNLYNYRYVKNWTVSKSEKVITLLA